MMEFLLSLSFVNPWVLAGLFLLPVLWYILRISPPSPRTLAFPAIRFLQGLIPDQQSHATTPWWILLLRMVILSLLLLALAGPIFNKSDQLPASDSIRVVIDNDWAASNTWSLQIEHATNIVSIAQREGKDVYVTTTAPLPGQTEILNAGPVTASEAKNIIAGLQYFPWPNDYELVEQTLKDATNRSQSIYSFYLSHGYNTDQRSYTQTQMISELQNAGGLSVYKPDDSQAGLYMIRTDADAPSSITRGQIVSPKKDHKTPLIVQALGQNGQILDRQSITLDPGKTVHSFSMDVPVALRNTIQKIKLTGQNHAASVLLFDDENKRRTIGLLNTGNTTEQLSLSDPDYYIYKALSPYHDLVSGDLDTVLDANPSVIVLIDFGLLAAQNLDRLEAWAKDGGLILRFAGPVTAASNPILVPVPLRDGERALDGSLTWDKPQQMAPFADNSPLYGLQIPDTITVKRQILADSSQDISNKIWASLQDGTPLITAQSIDDGMIVFFHVTAGPEWSDLPLTGTYVQILRRIINLAGKQQSALSSAGMLTPLLMVNERGDTVKPNGYERSVAGDQVDNFIPSSLTPPGLYGNGSLQHAFNLGDSVKGLNPIGSLRSSIDVLTYDLQTESNLRPALLMIAFLLFIVDWIIMLGLHIQWRTSSRLQLKNALKVSMALMFMHIALMGSASASNTGNWAQYANNLHLAYVPTGNQVIDETTQKGLEVLATALRQRTSAEPSGVVKLDLSQDYLSLFPFIYWPLSDTPKEMTLAELENLQSYLDNGGTILFDTRDQISALQQGLNSGYGRRAEQLRQMIGTLNVPDLEPIPDDHVLRKSFYLMQSFPGRYSGGTLWVETQSLSGRDGVSSIIIGSHDWATAWASAKGSSRDILVTGNRSQELALRFGVNIMMYALTGNYKSDQVHVPHILERLGQ